MLKRTASGIMLTVLLIGILVFAFDVQRFRVVGAIYHGVNEGISPSESVLVVDEIVGTRHVKYWEHVINGNIYVKNDFVLMHTDIESGEVLRYQKKWTEIKVTNVEVKPFNLGRECFWKKLVVFPDKDECDGFYTFYGNWDYPLVCWEVRYIDGTTIMYDLNGNEIGYGIPAPSNGFSLSGSNPWIDFRKNADYWFKLWCNSTVSLSLPAPSTISSYVSDPNFEYFYELAHGNSYFFLANSTYSSSYSSLNVATDMSLRRPMKFAFIGSCDGMTDTGQGTFSYEFRKGIMINTVTVGYTGMSSCPGWSVALPWQNYMFQKMNEGYTMKVSFDLASAEYPTIAPCVKFVGDINLQVLRHDVAVVDVVSNRTWVYQGHSININVTVLNKEDFLENVNVTLYYNITGNKIIGTQNITLPFGENQTISFTWDTTGVEYCHNYTLTAVASIAFLDNNPADNTFTDGKVKVRILGDINGDDKVNICDIVIACAAYGSKEGDPNWNPDVDLAPPYGIINIYDIVTITYYFGKTYQ